MRYYFHVDDGELSVDSDGVVLPNLASAKVEAVRACADMLRDAPGALASGKPWRLWVTDQPGGLGNTLFTIQISATEALPTLPDASNRF